MHPANVCPLSSFSSLSPNATPRSLNLALLAAAIAFIVLGLFKTQSTENLIAYLIIVSFAVVPCVLWVRARAVGIPILPVISALFIIYYAIPILRDQPRFTPSEVLSAAIAVAIFLGSATLAWWQVLVSKRRQVRNVPHEPILQGQQIRRVIFFGLGCGTFYYVALYLEWLTWLGPAFGLVRSVLLTPTTVACFMLGHARARGLLRGQKWALAVAGFAVIILLSGVSLFLVGAINLTMAAVFGYVITSKRIPWVLLVAAASVVMVLHAGKDEMRQKYWSPRTTDLRADTTISKMPEMMVEWVGAGLRKINSDRKYESAIERASLLSLLMRVQHMTPDYVPYLDGASYALLPGMLVPRFLDPHKTISGAAMIMLNIRYGFQTVAGTKTTAIGWGLIAEAIANFGYFGVVGIGILIGIVSGLFQRWSIDTQVLSLPSLLAIVAMLQFVNIEADLANLITSLWQAIAITWVLLKFFGLFSTQQHGLPDRAR
jgi:hypothetical protein